MTAVERHRKASPGGDGHDPGPTGRPDWPERRDGAPGCRSGGVGGADDGGSSNVRWVFAYGSLMWRPGFVYREAVAARLQGYHRSLCVYSHIHRGTPACPGLVLGLDRGGSCRGLAFGFEPEREAEVLAYLDEREMGTAVYERRRLPLLTARGRVPAWCYVVRRDHPQYAGRLPAARCLDLVLGGIGRSGHNVEYVINTVAHLEELGINDRLLGDLARRLRAGRPQPRAERLRPPP